MPSEIKKTENYLEMNKTMNIYNFFDEECQEWIIKALKDHKFLSRKQINELLWSKLPIGYTDEQKMKRIDNILQKMRKINLITPKEKRHWFLVEN